MSTCLPSLTDGSRLENRHGSHSEIRAPKALPGLRMGARFCILPALWLREAYGEFPFPHTLHNEPNRNVFHLWATTLSNLLFRAVGTASRMYIVLVIAVSGAWRLPVLNLGRCDPSGNLPRSSPRR